MFSPLYIDMWAITLSSVSAVSKIKSLKGFWIQTRIHTLIRRLEMAVCKICADPLFIKQM
jgi:hypothetical protein